MKALMCVLTVVVCLFGTFQYSGAITYYWLNIDPWTTSWIDVEGSNFEGVALGDSIAVKGWIDPYFGFDHHMSTYYDHLRGYDVDIYFDSSLLSFTGFELSSELGDPNDPSQTAYNVSVNGDHLRISQISWLSKQELIDRHPQEFMFWLYFDTIGLTGAVNYTQMHTDDTTTRFYDYDNASQVAYFEHGSRPHFHILPVPEPSTFIMLGIGIVVVIVGGRRYSRRR